MLNSRFIAPLFEQKITPDAIGMLVGEFAYALRSGLDHLAWQLALPATKADTPKRVFFPIVESVIKPSDAKDFGKALAMFPDAVAKEIKTLQPHNAGSAFKSHPLWQLNKLCTIDKHRVVAVGHIQFQVTLPLEFPHVLRRDTNDTIEICVPLADKAKFRIDVNCPGIVFGEPIEITDAVSDFEISIEGLESIYNFVRYDAVPKFERFFT